MTDDPVDDRTVRNFAWVMLSALALGAVGALRRGAPGGVAVALVGVGLGLVAVSRVAPRALVGFYRTWMALGEAMGRVTTPILLGLVFVVVLVPTRLALRLASKDPLTRRFDRAATTYWSERPNPGFPRENFERLW